MRPDHDPTPVPYVRARRRLVLAAALVALLLLAALVAIAAFSLELEEGDLAGPSGPSSPDGTGELTPAGGPPVERIALEPVSQPGPAGPVEIPLGDEEEFSFDPEGPCAGVTGADAAELVVSPASVTLFGGGSKGSVDIRNCDAATVAWSAATEAWVTLAETQGQLPSGATFRLLFTVDTTSLPDGGYEFEIEISRPGHTATVAVTGTKLGGFLAPGATPPPVPTIGGLVSPGPTGCADQCVTRAWLSTRPASADVSLEVSTNTPATIAALVDTEPPKFSTGGDPFFTTPEVHAKSDSGRKEWATTLAPLQPKTTYHIIVAAKDSRGGVSYRTGTFTTVAAATGYADQAPGGCTSACVKAASLTRTPGSAEIGVSVEAHVPLKMQVYANGVTAASSGGEFLTEWSAALDLAPGEHYEIKLKVTDQQGHSQTHQAGISIPEPVPSHQNRIRVSFHAVRVTDDADNTVFNRKGELRFRFEVGGEYQPQLDTGEHKVKAPATVGLGGRGVTIDNAPDRLLIRVQGLERDNSQSGFCSAGGGIYPETSGRTLIPNCYELEWNTAEGEIDLHDTVADQALPPCYGFPQGVHGDLCVALAATGDDPRFDVYLTIDFLDG